MASNNKRVDLEITSGEKADRPTPSSLRLADYVAPTLCRLDLPVLLHWQAPHRGSDPAGQGRRTPPPRLSHPVRALPPRPDAARLAGGEQTRTVPETVRRGRTRAKDGGADGAARIGVQPADQVLVRRRRLADHRCALTLALACFHGDLCGWTDGLYGPLCVQTRTA